MFTYAIRRKYIKENPLDAVQILVKFKQAVKKTGKLETYNTEELEQLNQYLDEKFLETQKHFNPSVFKCLQNSPNNKTRER